MVYYRINICVVTKIYFLSLLPMGITSCNALNSMLYCLSVFPVTDTVRYPRPPPGRHEENKNPMASSFCTARSFTSPSVSCKFENSD